MNKIKRLLHSYGYLLLAVLVMVGGWMGCTPNKGGSLGALPKSSFSVQGGGDSNTVILTSTTTGAISYWEVPGAGVVSGQTDTVSFIFSGTYSITQMVAAQGGIDSTSQTVTINQNDALACTTTTQGFVAGCTSRTWMLDPIASAEMIGPSPGSNEWWGNGASEPTGDRVCDFNDTWTFSFNLAGTMVYNNQGDYYTDNYMGNSNYDCDVNANLSATDQPWASGNFTYAVIPNAGSAGLGQLKVIGLGAHIGLPRVENGADLSSDVPVNSVTYDIIDTSHDVSGNAYMTLSINGTGGDWWSWVLKATD